MAAGNPIDILDGIDTSGFYFQLGVAQVFKNIYVLLKYIFIKLSDYFIKNFSMF